MARRKVFIQGDHYIGEFPHDAEMGFKASLRGLRRRLCPVDELKDMGVSTRSLRLHALYVAKEQEIRYTRFRSF